MNQEVQNQQIQELFLLQRVARRINSIIELDVLLEEIVGDVAETFGYTRSGVLLKDNVTNELVIAAVRGWTTNYHLKGERFKIGEYGMVGHVAATGETYYAPDVTIDPYYQVSEELTRSEVDIPLKIRGRLIGVFSTQHNETDAFSPERIQLLEALAGHIAAAIENARLFHGERLEKQRALVELDKAHDIKHNLSPKQSPIISQADFYKKAERKKWERVREIFDAALKLAPDERERFLVENCSGDEELHREVQSLLSSFDSANSFLQKPAVSEIADVIESGDKKPENGKRFGHYRIIKQIGAGGMGEVFLAEDVRLDRKVALKILPAQFAAGADGLNRFIQEAKSASALNHPNIITVFDIGEFEGKHFIAVEFIDGQTLRERVNQAGRISFDEILSICIQTAEALSAAHAAGIVHRDIKPENIMIRPDGYIKVLDFGLAKLTERNDAEEAGAEDATRKLVKTNPGVVMGTAAYMSPEQARGTGVDARSDVFSFGVMMYEIFAGRAPFTGETAMDVIQSVINSEPQPLAAFAPHLPKELVRIVHKTIKKKREQRYQTIKDLLNDLKDLRDELQQELILEKTAVPNRAETGEAKQSSAQQQQLSTSSGGRLRDSLLLVDFENTTGEAIFDHTLKTALAFSLGQSPFLDIAPEAKIAQSLRQMKRQPSERVTRELAEELCLRMNLKAYLAGSISNLGSIYFLTLEAVNARTGESLGREYEQANNKEEILAALSHAASGIREKLGESLSSIQKYDMPLDLTTSSFEALKFYSFGREQEFSGKQLEAIPFYQKALEFDSEFASAYAALAVIYANTNQWKQAKENATKAFEMKDSVGENEKLHISYFYYAFVTGEMDKAISTLELWRKTYTSTVSPFINLADCYMRLGQFERAVAVCREGLSSANVAAAPFYLNLPESLLSLGHFDEAKETCRKAFAGNFDIHYFHVALFQVGFIENDSALMAEQLKWFGGRNDEYLALDLQAGAAAHQGKWRATQDFSRRAIDLAARTNAREVAARFTAEQALRIVFWSAGSGLPKGDESQLKTVLKTQTNKALNLERGKDVMSRAALALAVAGQAAEANALADEMHNERPADTLLNELWMPLVRAAVLLQSGKSKEAVEELEITERYERAAEFYPQYLRGLAYLQSNKPKAAIKELDKILNHRGEAPLSSIYPLAQLVKARAMKDKAEYEKFFELWKEADLDMPALIEAKKEYDNLNGRAS